MRFTVLILLLALLAWPNATARTQGRCETNAHLRYVSTTGNDRNDGSACRPWRTIGHAAIVVNPGATVIVQDGTYPETLAIGRSGTSTAPIVFKSQTKWGAKIAPPQTTSGIMVDINANYVTFQDFEVIGTPNVTVGLKAHSYRTNVNILGNNIHSMGNGSTCLRGGGIEPGADNSYTNGNWIWDIGFHRDRTTGGLNGKGRCNLQHGIYPVSGNNSFIQNNVIFEVYQGVAMHINATINHMTITTNTIFNVGDANHNSGSGLTFECDGSTGPVCDYNSFSNNIMVHLSQSIYGTGCFYEIASNGASFGTHNVYANNLVDGTCLMAYNTWVTGHDVNTIVRSRPNDAGTEIGGYAMRKP